MVGSMIDNVWAKLDRQGRALPLVDHNLDVAAVLEAILLAGAWNGVLAHAAGRAMREQDLVRLVALAALHDIGKANRGFQLRRDPKAPWVGHEGEVAALVRSPRLRETAVSKALQQILRDWGAAPYLAALMAHHGRPRAEFQRQPSPPEPWGKHVGHWLPADGYDPADAAAQLIDTVRARYPMAWDAGEALPKEERFVAAFAGLLVLADWTGSDTRRFPVEGPHGIGREAMRIAAASDAVAARGLAPVETPDADFIAAFGFAPRGVQGEAAADDLGPIALIEAETGSGKTEAALWRWLELRRRGQVDGLYFALPTRSAAVQLHARVDRMLRQVWGEDAPRAVLAVPGYLRMGGADGERLPGRQVRWDDDMTGQPVDSRWAAEQSSQYLAARVAVGTIDQALLGALRVRHAPMRAVALARSLLVVDEVHASDAYMGGLLERLLANHAAAGGHAVLLSATLGATARARLLGQSVPTLADGVVQPYPALGGSAVPMRASAADGPVQKRVAIEVVGLIDDPVAIAGRAIEAARRGASVLVVRNTVAAAVAVAQAIEADAPELAFRVGDVATVHHGRFAPDDRRLLDTAVEAAFGKHRSMAGRILVGTQTLEQSLDIDADLLISDLAPMDVLLQRIGRLHRHAGRDRGAFAEARVIVLRPAERDLTPAPKPGRTRHGLGSGPYPDIVQLEATLRLLAGNDVVTIPADNRRLVEHALHPEIRDAIVAELGTAWHNRAVAHSAKVFAERDQAIRLSLDLSTPFRDLVFPTDDGKILTRLGARDLLVDLDPAPVGPFGATVGRITIPAWMAHGVRAEHRPTVAVPDADGWRFDLGPRAYHYGRWGLVALQ